MISEDTAVILGIIGILNGAQLLFVNSIRNKIDKLSNGCFNRHMELAKKEGQTEMTLVALHNRVDKIEEPKCTN